MNVTVSASFKTLPPLTALVVEPDLGQAVLTVATLSTSGFRVTVAQDYHEAKTLLGVQPPAILVTDIRLREYNGLHLVLRGKSSSPRMSAVVTSTFVDSVLQADAEQMGATFVHKPVTQPELLAAVMRTLLRQDSDPASGPIRAPFERRRSDRRQTSSTASLLPNRRCGERRTAPRLVGERASMLG
jgi:DNA-binding response OmpR family regulator